MKYKKFKDDWSHDYHEEFILFYSMCGEKDRAFFNAPDGERSTEDHARLMCIALAFGFRKLVLGLIDNVVNLDDMCSERGLGVVKDAATFTKWCDDFVREIPIPEFREVAAETWEAMRSRIQEDSFDFRDFL